MAGAVAEGRSGRCAMKGVCASLTGSMLGYAAQMVDALGSDMDMFMDVISAQIKGSLQFADKNR